MITKAIVVLLIFAILLPGCVSSTVIDSKPRGAKLYIDGMPVGRTPYSHSDTKIVGSTTHVRLEADGYEPFHSAFSRNEQVDIGAIIGGLFFIFPYLWVMKYAPGRYYELRPLGGEQTTYPSNNQQITSPQGTQRMASPANVQKSKGDLLREIKALYDEGILTLEEYEAEKKKIMAK